jgi:NAD(P)-dependent dehydrogenase (short-subunit alcohol dehydrogenase family)
MALTQPRRVCLLTGASGVLGRAFCAAYRDQYDIVAVYRRERPWFPSQDARVVDPLARDEPVAENEHPIYALRADLFVPGEARRVVESTLARFGRLDLLVNAAVSTVWAPMLGSMDLVNSVQRQFAMAVDVPLRLATLAAQLCWQADAQRNRESNRNIVNVSSVAALRVYEGSGQSVYAASKAAMNHLTAHMAAEFAAVGVRVNATAANSFPQLVSVQRAADAVRTLDTSTRTGSLLVVDGEKDEWRELDRAAP